MRLAAPVKARYINPVTTPLALMLLPGLHGTCGLIRELARKLELFRPVVMIDYPADPHFDFDAHVEFVRARAPDGPFAVLGESFSGPFAIALAHREPRVAGLILASTFAKFPLPPMLAPVASFAMGLPLPPRYTARALAGRSATPELIDEVTDLIAALPKRLVRHRVGIALAADMSSTLARISCPVLCLTGRRDHLTGPRALASITGARPDARVHRFDAGHMLLETHAGEAADVVEDFCARLDRPPHHSG